MAEYVPRLTSDGMYGNYWWYSRDNIYYPANGLPNCTCYAYGRWGEIRGEFADLPGFNAEDWYAAATNFERGQTPQLGAIICYGGENPDYYGHVAVVEVINEDGSIITSNSGYNSDYFWTAQVYPSQGYIDYGHWGYIRDYHCQGFIYIDVEPVPPQPPTPITIRRGHRLPIWMYGI